MAHYKMTPEERDKRNHARRTVVGLGNQVKARHGQSTMPFRMRHIQQAVRAVRQAGPLSTKGKQIFKEAGYNAEG